MDQLKFTQNTSPFTVPRNESRESDRKREAEL